MAAKKAAASKGPINKTQFVLSQPDLTAAEIVAKGKAAGIDLHPGYIYEIRSAARRKGKAPAKAKAGRSAPAAAPAASAPSGAGESSRPKKMTKRNFVLGLPFDLSAADVVKKAKDAGFVLSPKYVYNIRGSAGKSGGRAAGVGRSELRAAALGGGGQGSSRAAEARFVEAALDLGFARAEELLGRIRSRVQSLTD